MSTDNFFKIGNHHCNDYALINNEGCRTIEQYNTFLSLKSDVLFLCCNPFCKDEPDEKYNRTFRLRYFNNIGQMVSCDITPTGILKNKFTSGTTDLEIELVEKKIKSLKSRL